MKCNRLFFIIFLALVFLFATNKFEAVGGNARSELEKKGYTFSESSFIDCAEKGDIEAAKMFISEGININACDNEGQSALMRASLFGHNEMVRLLLDKGADIKIRNKETQSTALMEAVAGNHADVIRLLAQNGADVNERDVLNRTPLHVACMWGFIEVADTLIELGSNTDALDMTDQTPLMVAEQNGNTKIVEFLKSAGVKK